MIEIITRCDGFFNIITQHPRTTMPFNVAHLLCSLESVNGDPATATFLVNEEEERRFLFPLVLQTYRLTDSGAITQIDDIPFELANEVYQQALYEPEEAYDKKTFRRNKLKPVYKYLFEFVHNVFLSYAGSNEAVTFAKFKLLAPIVRQLSVNWGRLLVNLFLKEAEELPSRLNTNMPL